MPRNTAEYTAERPDEANDWATKRQEAHERAVMHFSTNLETYASKDPDIANELRNLINEGPSDHAPSWLTQDADKRRNFVEAINNFTSTYTDEAADSDTAYSITSAIISLSYQQQNQQLNALSEGRTEAHTLRAAETFDPQSFDQIVSCVARHYDRNVDEFVADICIAVEQNDIDRFHDAIDTFNSVHRSMQDAVNQGPNEYFMGQTLPNQPLQEAKNARFQLLSEELSHQLNPAEFPGGIHDIASHVGTNQSVGIDPLVDFAAQQMPGDQHLIAAAFAQLACHEGNNFQNAQTEFDRNPTNQMLHRLHDLETNVTGRYYERIKDAIAERTVD